VSRWRLVAGILLLSLLWWPALPAQALGPVQVWVDDGYCQYCGNDGHTWGVDAFDTISEAVRGVAAGGTVYIRPGNYQEDVRIARPCKLVADGSGESILSPRFDDVTLTIAANDVSLQGLQIVGSKQAAILVLGPDFQREQIRSVALRQNVIRGGQFGVAVNVDSRRSHDPPELAPILADRTPSPVRSGALPGLQLANNSSSSQPSWNYGLLPATGIVIDGNTVSGCKRSIYVYNAEASIEGNAISELADDGIGIYSSQGSIARIRRNTVSVDAPGSRAVYILDNRDTTIEGNKLVGTTEILTPTTALVLYSYTNLLVADNTIHGFYWGASAGTGGSARIVGNTFEGTVGWALDVGTAITTTQVAIENNVIRDSYGGLRLDDNSGYGLEAAVEGNAFHDNVVAIQLGASVAKDQVRIRGNTICGNLVAGLRNDSQVPVDAANNWWGSNDGPRPAGSGDRIEGAGAAFVDPWLRLLASTRVQRDGRVTVTASFGSSGYYLRDRVVTFTTNAGTFAETSSASRTTFTDQWGEAQATLFPPPNGAANITVSSTCGQAVTVRAPSSLELRPGRLLPPAPSY
jgi:hypothetical protein